MSGLLWPGAERAAGILDDADVVAGMLAVEDAWLAALVEHRLAPESAGGVELSGLVRAADLPDLAAAAESGGTPVIPLVALLRERAAEAGHPDAARWLHRGLTSQDVVDTALVLGAQRALDAVGLAQRAQLGLLDAIASTHRDTPMVARTLTQHAVPTTFGLKAAGWATGVLGAAVQVAAVRRALPVQLGGAAGTMAAAVELGVDRGGDRGGLDRGGLDQGGLDQGGGAAEVTSMIADVAPRLGLAPARPWHTTRQPVTAIGDALLAATDAWGHLAADVLVMARSEVAEVSFADGGGGSSTMPHKSNPVLPVLVRRAALAAPALAQTLHLAAATAVDERSDGAWHAEWETLALLARRTVVAAGQVTELLEGLRPDPDRMAATLASATDVDAEQRAMADLAGHDPAGSYTGLAGGLVDAALAEVRGFLTARHEAHHERGGPEA